jgi:hypothetical protein
MCAFEASSIRNFWVATGLRATIVLFNLLSYTIGEFPLSNSEVPDNLLSVAEDLLAGNEIDFELTKSIPCNKCAHFYNSVH